MPHICGPHSQLASCRYHGQRSTAGLEPPTTWVPIPIQKVSEAEHSPPSFPTSGSRVTSVPINGFRAPGQGPAVPGGYRAPGPQGTTVPIQLAAPGLIMKAKRDANADELFPREMLM